MRDTSVIDASPPIDAGSGGGGGGWAWLLTARGIIEAELVRGVLECSGIVPVLLDATDPSPEAWMFMSGNTHALVRVYVPTSLLEAARLAMLETGFDAEAAQDEPETLSPRTIASRARIVVAAIALIAFAVATLASTVSCSRPGRSVLPGFSDIREGLAKPYTEALGQCAQPSSVP